MTNSRNSLVDQLKGASLLVLEATRNITDLVEAMHHTIGSGPDALGRPLESLTKLLTAPTYRSIRGVTGVVATSLDHAFSKLEPLLNQSECKRGPLLAVLNGVVGDYLAESQNALSIEMKLCSGGAGLELTPEALSRAFPEGGRLLLLVHGSCVDETIWRRKPHDYGAALAAECGFIPLYLRYNSGLHVSQNGRAFAQLLEQLVKAWPRPVEELLLLTHSMGGLVARSACHFGEVEAHDWRKKLRALLTLGTPHHGAPLERGGNWVDIMLGISRYSAPLARLGKLRSAGVTDLRYGIVLDEHWEGRDRFAHHADPRSSLTLPEGVACFAVAASTASTASASPSGDGLVPVDSALGHHKNPALELKFDKKNQWIALGHSHLDLLSSKEVYAKILTWIKALDDPLCLVH